MYRIAVLSDRAELAACFTEQINRFCMERGHSRRLHVIRNKRDSFARFVRLCQLV